MIYRRDRNSHGGGVFIAVSINIPSRLLFTSSSVELIAIEIYLETNITVCALYIPPTTSATEQYMTDVAATMHDLSLNQNPLLVLGDCNCPDINWNTMSASIPSSNILCETTFSLNLLQIVDSPTHIHGNILDVILINDPDLITDLLVEDNTDQHSSHHFLITFKLINRNIYKTCNQSRNKPKRLVYSNADLHSISAYLSQLQLPENGIDSMWNCLKTEILTACSMYIPTVTL